jgi:putative copper resistance protein D
VWLVAARISGGSLISALHPESLGVLLESTQFGRVCEARLVLAVGFVTLFVVKRQRTQFAQLLLAAAMLATLSLAGHAGASVGKGHWVHLVDDTFHLIAAGVWPAGLAPFAIFLAETLQAKQLYEIQVAALFTQRFSFISLVTVGALAITGAVNGYFLVGTFHGLIATIYGRLLILKVAVFGIMIMIGALNLLLLKPRIVIAAQSAAVPESLTLVRLLRRNVMVELSLGVILMIVVGVLGVTPPAAHSDMSRNIPHGDNHTAAVQALKDL